MSRKEKTGIAWGKYFIWAILLLIVSWPILKEIRPFFAKEEIPELTGRVVDRAEVISGTEKETIEKAIRTLETETGGQMAVLTIPSLNGAVLEEYSIKVAEKWKIGSKEKDNGAILILAVKDHQLRLEIGYGWEGKVNDARAGDIIREMTPLLKKEQYADASLLAIDRVREYLTGKKENKPDSVQKKAPEEESDFMVWLIVGFFVLVIVCKSFLFGGHSGGGSSGGGFRDHDFSGGGSFGGGGGSFGGGGSSGKW